YQDIKDEIIKDIAQLDLTITEIQENIDHLNKVAEVFLNLYNNDIENRRLANSDHAKMNLTAAIKLEQVEKELEIYQIKLDKSIDDYEYLIRRLVKFVKILNEIDSSKDELKFEHS
ncbi:helical hairpin domain-containing protein, partial [Streptococcus suis]